MTVASFLQQGKRPGATGMVGAGLTAHKRKCEMIVFGRLEGGRGWGWL